MLHSVVKYLLSPDANLNDSSSESFGTAHDMQQQVDNAGADSSAAQDDNTVTKEPTMAEAIEQALEGKLLKTDNKVVEESSSNNEQDLKDEKTENVDDKKEDVTNEAKAKESAEGDTKHVDGEADTNAVVEGKPVPYERFTEVNTQLKSTRQELELARPAVENYRQIDTFCRANNITPEQFQKVLQVQALLNTNPEAALKELQPIVDSLKGFTGDVLPSELQAAVDSGDITLKYAKEVAASRAQMQFGQKKFQHDQQSLQRQQQALVQQQLSDAVTSWETNMRATDPDYKPKTKATEPDGKWEKVKREFLGMLHETDANGQFVRPVKSPQEFTSLLQEAYASVDSYTKRISAPRTIKKPLRSSSSSTNGHDLRTKSIEDAPTLQEAVARGLAQRR